MTTKPRRFQPGSHGYSKFVRGIVRQVLSQPATATFDLEMQARARAARKGRR